MEHTRDELFNAMKNLGVDVDKTVSRFMDNAEIYETFLKRFPDEDRLTPIKEALAEKNTDRLVETSHKMKGVTANLGMNELSAAAEVIVKKARENTLDGVEEDLARVEALYNTVCGAIKENI